MRGPWRLMCSARSVIRVPFARGGLGAYDRIRVGGKHCFGRYLRRKASKHIDTAAQGDRVVDRVADRQRHQQLRQDLMEHLDQQRTHRI
jgi:hypothetical protein